ncbi:MAG: putative quinol monooxygenase [Candidatus Omnitrophota bacterium]|nr:putative quinol monooxygenase [Candidatus Omnitrophota bacterium]
MVDGCLTVVAEMTAKQGKEETLKEELLKLLEPTRMEEGCINYDMHQSHDKPGFFIFYENWISKAHLERHLATPHLKAFFAKEADLLEGVVVIHLMRQC